MSYMEGVREHLLAAITNADEATLRAVVRVIEGQHGKEGSSDNNRDATSPLMDEEDDSPHGTEAMASLLNFDLAAAALQREEKPSVASNLFGSTTSLPVSAREGGAARSEPAQPVEPPTPAAAASSLVKGRNNRRIAVSAGPSIAIEQVRNFKPREIPKTEEETALCRKGVAACHLFSGMDDDDQMVIVKAMEKETFAVAVDILKQGMVTNSKFYLIAEGTANVVKSGKVVATLGNGSTFGELEMMYDTAENAASITTVTPSVLFSLDRETYRNTVLNISVSRRELYAELLKGVIFLQNMSDYDRNQLADALTPATYQKGDYIINFGERGSWMHFLLEGEVEVIGRDKGKKVLIIKLGKGEVVGELEFLFDQLTVADVIATTKVKTAKMNKAHFEKCMGPITDELKRFIAKGKYEHFLSVVDNVVLKEIKQIEKKLGAKRVNGGAGSSGAEFGLGEVDRDGEIILTQEIKNVAARRTSRGARAAAASNSDLIKALYRFPLLPVHEANIVLIGLREDGTIVLWNDVMTKITNYPSTEVVGQSFFSFLHNMKEQKTFHESLSLALNWVGNAQGFFAAAGNVSSRSLTDLKANTSSDGGDANDPMTARGADELEEDEPERRRRLKALAAKAMKNISKTYTFARSDGLTKSQIQLAVFPSSVAQSGEIPNMALAVGIELKGRSKTLDHAQWMSDQIKELVHQQSTSGSGAASPGPGDSKDLFNGVKLVLEKFDTMTKNVSSSENNVQRVVVRHLFQQTESNFTAEALKMGNHIELTVDAAISKAIYIDATVLPEVLKYALSNCVKHCKQSTIKVKASYATEMGLDYLEVEFEDNGPGIPDKVLQAFQNPTAVSMSIAGTMIRVRHAVNKLGGSMKVDSMPNHTIVTFRFPFVAADEDDDSDDEGQSALGAPDGNGDLSASMSVGAVEKKKREKHHFTTLVAEQTTIHRNMISAFVWERKHAVIPANHWSDIQSAIANANIAIIDPQQYAAEATEDIFAYLREQSRKRAIIITAETFEDQTRQAYDKHGYFTLTKPCTMLQAIAVFKRAEEYAGKIIADSENIRKTREAFTKTNRGKLIKGALLGKGSFGEVYEVIDVLTGGKMAMKVINSTAVDQKELVNEIKTQCDLQHENIIHYFSCEEEGDTIKLYMEFAPGGTLQGMLQKCNGQGLERKELVRVIREVLLGVEYVHQQGFVHCDLKTANVLLSAEKRCKIGDFGTARKIAPGEKLYVMNGTPLYMSPECMSAGEEGEGVDRIGYDSKTDIWSIGWIVFELFTGKQPYSHIGGLTQTGLLKYVTTLCDSPDLSPLFQDPAVFAFVRACLDVEPAKRPTASQLLEFNLLKDTDEDMASAEKALKKAQLLHTLEKFVAFQEPIDEKDRELEEILQRLAKGGGKKKSVAGGVGDGNFFDSDDDDSADGGGFFETSEEDEDEDDAGDSDDDGSKKRGGGKKKHHGGAGKPNPVAVGAHHAAPAIPSQNSDDDDDKPPTTSNTVNRILTTTTTKTDAPAPTSPPPPAPSAAAAPPSAPAPASGSANDVTKPKVMDPPPPLAPRNGTPDVEPLKKRRSFTYIKDATTPTSLTPHPPPRAVTPPAEPLERSVAADDETTRASAVIALHDALWQLIETIRSKCTISVEARNALEEQYLKVKQESERVMNSSGSDAAAAPSAADATATTTAATRFKPNVTEVLRTDTQLAISVAQSLGGDWQKRRSNERAD